MVALERYPLDKAQMQAPVRNVAQSAARADAIFVAGRRRCRRDRCADARRSRSGYQARAAPWYRVVGRPAGLFQCAGRRRLVCRTGIPGFRNFSARYRGRYGQDPVRTASLSYDAVALVAALVKTQGQQRFSEGC